jgi:hypothetical protein
MNSFYKCLSLWQPWASLIAIGAKRIETRGYWTNHRGPLVIHAAKNTSEMYLLETDDFLWPLLDAKLLDYDLANHQLCGHSLPLGAAVALVDLVDCVSSDKIRPSLSQQERAFGNYAPGRFGYILENIRPFKEAIPLRGAQGFFNVDSSLFEGKLAPLLAEGI